MNQLEIKESETKELELSQISNVLDYVDPILGMKQTFEDSCIDPHKLNNVLEKKGLTMKDLTLEELYNYYLFVNRTSEFEFLSQKIDLLIKNLKCTKLNNITFDHSNHLFSLRTLNLTKEECTKIVCLMKNIELLKEDTLKYSTNHSSIIEVINEYNFQNNKTEQTKSKITMDDELANLIYVFCNDKEDMISLNKKHKLENQNSKFQKLATIVSIPFVSLTGAIVGAVMGPIIVLDNVFDFNLNWF